MEVYRVEGCAQQMPAYASTMLLTGTLEKYPILCPERGQYCSTLYTTLNGFLKPCKVVDLQ